MQENIIVSPNHLQYQATRPQTSGVWHTFLDESLSTRAQEIALVVSERMRDPDFVHVTAEQASQQAVYPTGWYPLSLGSGDVGLALMYGYIHECFPEKSWDTSTQQYLGIAAASTQRSNFWSSALFSGTSGMALALALASQGGQRYQKTLARLHEGLCEQVLQQSWRRPDSDGGVAANDYDIISGAAGVLAYLVSVEQPDEYVQAAIEHILAYLTWLAEPGQPVGQERWYIPPTLLPNDLHREATPQGNFNCGLAHGMPGPLAALALTWLAGYRYPGLRESITYLASWIEEHHVNTPWGIDWPGSIPLERSSDPQEWQSLPAIRSAWCYGAPGIARSLWLAGQALDDEHVRCLAIEAIEATLNRPAAERYLPSSHLCHGVAGLLQICLRFANECESALVREHIPVLVKQILDAFDPASTLGFCDLDDGKPLANPTWLTGAAGIAMTLLAASTPVVPAWDRVLVIA